MLAKGRPLDINCATESAAHNLHSTRLQGGWEEEEEEEEEQEGAPGQVTNTVLTHTKHTYSIEAGHKAQITLKANRNHIIKTKLSAWYSM